MVFLLFVIIAGVVVLILGRRQASRPAMIAGATLIALPVIIGVLFYPITTNWNITVTPFP